jgi:hypothetical protein
MAKKATGDSDEMRLKKKIQGRQTDSAASNGDPALRTLRKRLKRTQRKRRALAQRKRHAAGSQAEAKTEAATG